MNDQNRRPQSTFLIHALGASLLLTIPSFAVASEQLESTDPAPATNTQCGQSTVELEIDVANGDVFYVHPVNGNVLLNDNALDVYFGSLGHVLLKLNYTSSEWYVDITPDDDPSVTYRTSNGSLRYSISDSYDEYLFESTENTSMASMMNMVPVVPNIRIRTRAGCP